MSQKSKSSGLQQFVSANVFGQRVGLKRAAILDRIQRGTLTAQRDREGRYFIPVTEIARVSAEVELTAEAFRAKRETVKGMEQAIDDQIAYAGTVVQECATALLAHTIGTPNWRSALQTLSKAIDAQFKAWELQVPYLALAKRVEIEGLEFLHQINDEAAPVEPTKKKTAVLAGRS